MNPVTSKISEYCSKGTIAESCGLLVRDHGSEVRCRFVSCMEKHVYTCNGTLTSISIKAEGSLC